MSHELEDPVEPLPRAGRWALAIAWPSFLMAALLEILVFALIDPADLAWLGGGRLDLSRQAVYTLGFLLFWLIISLAAGLSLLLACMPDLPTKSRR